MNSILLAKELTGDFQEVLREQYIESEFIDPVEGIIEKIEDNKASISRAFGVYLDCDLVAFFVIENSNPSIRFNDNYEGSYWLESFFVTKKYKGKGFAKSVVFEIIRTLKKQFSDTTSLNLTVNIRNHVAKKIYQDCGIVDTGKIYSAGPAGPQHIYSIKLKC